MGQLLELLKTQIDPSLFVKKDQEEGSSSNSPNSETEENKKKEDDGMFYEAIVSISSLFLKKVLYCGLYSAAVYDLAALIVAGKMYKV